jgi:hypothetical protein
LISPRDVAQTGVLRCRIEDPVEKWTMPIVEIDDGAMASLQTLLKTDSPVEITSDALRLLQWAATEAAQGRTIFSADAKGTRINKLDMPSVSRAAT